MMHSTWETPLRSGLGRASFQVRPAARPPLSKMPPFPDHTQVSAAAIDEPSCERQGLVDTDGIITKGKEREHSRSSTLSSKRAWMTASPLYRATGSSHQPQDHGPVADLSMGGVTAVGISALNPSPATAAHKKRPPQPSAEDAPPLKGKEGKDDQGVQRRCQDGGNLLPSWSRKPPTEEKKFDDDIRGLGGGSSSVEKGKNGQRMPTAAGLHMETGRGGGGGEGGIMVLMDADPERRHLGPLDMLELISEAEGKEPQMFSMVSVWIPAERGS